MYRTTVKDYSPLFPRWRASMESLFPFKINRIFFVSNDREINPHRDGIVLTDHLTYASAVRILLVDENPKPTFWFSKEKSKESHRFYMDLPPETNTFVFNNPRIYHSAEYHGHRKILMILILDHIDEQKWFELLLRSSKKWTERAWIDKTE